MLWQYTLHQLPAGRHYHTICTIYCTIICSICFHHSINSLQILTLRIPIAWIIFFTINFINALRPCVVWCHGLSNRLSTFFICVVCFFGKCILNRTFSLMIFSCFKQYVLSFLSTEIALNTYRACAFIHHMHTAYMRTLLMVCVLVCYIQ